MFLSIILPNINPDKFPKIGKGASDVFTEEEANPEFITEYDIQENKKNKLHCPKSKSRNIEKI